MGCQYIWHGYGPNTTIFLYIWPHRPVWGYIVFIISNGADRPYFRFSHSTPPILGRSYITEYDRQYDIDHHLTPHFGHYRGSHHSLFRILRGAGFLMGSDTIWVSPKKSLHFFRREGSTSIVCSHFHSVPFLPDAMMMMMKVVHWW